MFFDQFHSGDWDLLNPRLLFSLGIFMVSSGLLALTVREKRWIGAFDLEEKIRDLERVGSTPAQPIITEEMIARLVEAAIEKRLKPESSDKTA
ncbi:unnamed protein product [Sphagnum jensenii]|uniref:Uncharacterized protein n=1 Tax=Sphagnum jensenii TaxID=128206 RepID=A0ABP0V754_9BRYO